MIAERTFDVDLIKSVLFNDVIWNACAEDGQSKDDLEIDADKNCFVAIHAKQEVIGIYILHPHNSATLEIHAHILPEHRKEHAIASGQSILQWFKLNAPDNYQKLLAQIPVIHPNVRDFCLKQGFKMEGLLTKSYWKNGELCSQWLMGLSRGDI